MNRMSRWFCALAMLALSSGVWATTYFVDHEDGDDQADGRNAESAWRHSPGDPSASGRAAQVVLEPGDVVRFRGGVRYRGHIRVPASGAQGRPITFSGTGFGEGRAIIDGADPVPPTVPCESRSACGNLDNWKVLAVGTINASPGDFPILFDELGALAEARLPPAHDDEDADDRVNFFEIPLSQKGEVEQGRLRTQALTRRYGDQLTGDLLIWVRGNQLARRRILGVQGDTIMFNPDGIRLYRDRPGRFAVLGLPAAISRPRQFARIGTDRFVLYPGLDSSWVAQGSGRGGFDIAGASHVEIRDFLFEHQAAWPGNTAEGIAIFQGRATSRDIAIADNIIRHGIMWNGAGVITLRQVSGAVVRGNRIHSIARGSGLRAANTSHLQVSDNEISAIGRTGIAFLGVTDGLIARNRLHNLNGIHGNGVSLYLANRRVTVVDNRITDSLRPMTFHGDKSRDAEGDHSFRIARNLFVSSSRGRAAISSWGANTRDVLMVQNIAIGGRVGFLLDATDQGVRLQGNYGNGYAVKNGDAGPDWDIGGNRFDAASADDATDYESPAFLCGKVRLETGQSIAGVTCP